MRIPQALRELQSELGAEVFLVGGAVRDHLRGHRPHDLDFVARNVSVAAFEDFLSARGQLNLVGQSFGVYLFRQAGEDYYVEVSFPRTEISTGDGHQDFLVKTDPMLSLEEDSGRRDFTLNALYIPIEKINSDGDFRANEMIDYHHGEDHIGMRLIVAVGDPEARIEEDPLRMLRAMVLVARTGFRLEGRTFNAIKKHVRKIRSVSAERIRDEFLKIVESEKPSRAFKSMKRTGLLREIFPELQACVDCGQNPRYHSYPVFEHLIYATDAACSISRRLDVRLGTLFHDLGKAPTRALREGATDENDVSFHNHELESTKLAYAFMCRLRFPRRLIEDVIRLVRQHQYKYERTWSDKAVRRFIKATGIVEADLGDLDNHPQFLVRQADRMGNELKAHLPITHKQRDFQDRIRKTFKEGIALSLKDLAVNGSDLMSELGIPAGPELGAVLQHLYDLVETDVAWNNREALLDSAKNFLARGQKEETE